MNIQTREKRTTIQGRLLIVGLPFPATSVISGLHRSEEHLAIRDFSHPIECLDFLKSEQPEDVQAIIADLPTLERGGFHFLVSLRKLRKYSDLPVIGIAPGWAQVNRSELLKKGLDDCYVEPVEWSVLSERIQFLRDFKASDHKVSPMMEVSEYKMPLWKRAFDLIVASIGLIILAVPFGIVALIIWLTDFGGVFYISKRAGTGYKIFGFIKFRTMIEGADQQINELQHLNTYSSNSDKMDNSVFVKLKDDPRVTRIGKILRKTSFDELPQLINVIKGDMSIVGNRPLPLYEAKELTRDAWAARFNAPAGITGLWQIDPRGKENLTMDERIRLDIEYSKNISFWKDLKIIFRTPRAMLQKGE